MKLKKILWLTSWYPNKIHPYDGDFIQRHARAVSGFCEVQVIYVIKDESSTGQAGYQASESGNLKEQVIFYRSLKTGIALLDRIISHLKYKKTFRKAIRNYLEINGKPNLLHVHVAMKAGIPALWTKKKWNIPYLLTEHWVGYLPEADSGLSRFSPVYRNLTSKIFRQASCITVVSDHLGKAIQRLFPDVEYIVVPNVVDTCIFFSGEVTPVNQLRLIHVSNMNYQKNTEAILQAMEMLQKEGIDFELQLYGPVRPALEAMVTKAGLGQRVFFKGEVQQEELASEMRRSDALILYSRFETFGCVLIEANACGIPVIVSDLDVLHELVEDNVNGLFVKGEEPGALADKIREFSMQRSGFDHAGIAKTAALRYNYAEIGRRFADLYEKYI